MTTYGAIAEALGRPGGARQVGWAMAAAPEGVPAHRVVNRENPRPNKTAQKAEANTKNPELSPAKMPM